MSVYRLLKDIPDTIKGTLFHFHEDDGLYHKEQSSEKVILGYGFNRDIVENNSEWFQLQKEYSHSPDDGNLFITGFHCNEKVFDKSYSYFPIRAIKDIDGREFDIVNITASLKNRKEVRDLIEVLQIIEKCFIETTVLNE